MKRKIANVLFTQSISPKDKQVGNITNFMKKGFLPGESFFTLYGYCTVCPRNSDTFQIVTYYINGLLLLGHIV